MTRHRVAVFSLLILSVASSLWYLLDVVKAYSLQAATTSMTVANFDARYATLRKALQPHSVLGYISDPNTDVEAQMEYYLTEYALAPAIVKYSTDERLVVANFHSNKQDQAMLRAKNLVRVQDFGNDIFIYRNVTK